MMTNNNMIGEWFLNLENMISNSIDNINYGGMATLLYVIVFIFYIYIKLGGLFIKNVIGMIYVILVKEANKLLYGHRLHAEGISALGTSGTSGTPVSGGAGGAGGDDEPWYKKVIRKLNENKGKIAKVVLGGIVVIAAIIILKPDPAKIAAQIAAIESANRAILEAISLINELKGVPLNDQRIIDAIKVITDNLNILCKARDCAAAADLFRGLPGKVIPEVGRIMCESQPDVFTAEVLEAARVAAEVAAAAEGAAMN